MNEPKTKYEDKKSLPQCKRPNGVVSKILEGVDKTQNATGACRNKE